MARPARRPDTREVVYAEDRWRILEDLRREAEKIMRPLEEAGLSPTVHGSLARGDVDRRSDVDVFIPFEVPSYRVELSLEGAGITWLRREIVMATPWQLPKAHITIDEGRSVTFPLVKPVRTELEFYRFGGAISFSEVLKGARTPGVDKRLMLIEPTPDGHLESPVIGREAEVARRVGVSLDIVRERVQVLRRRAEIGHTGIFVKRELAPDESFEEVFRELVREKPAMKLRMKRRPP
ncbi:MAG: nucleotidyltransferase domain-containing protein [Candidatus Hadarchaeales archaeon]